MPRLLIAALVFLGLVSATAGARAFSPVRQPPPSRITGPTIARHTELRVESARLPFVHGEAARDVESFEARYTVVNPDRVFAGDSRRSATASVWCLRENSDRGGPEPLSRTNP